MTDPDPQRDLLERATAALEGIDRTVASQGKAFERQAVAFDRQAESFEKMMRRMDEDRAEARAHHERMIRRMERSETIFVEAIGDIDQSIQRNTDRLEDMRESIRANTQAILSVLDRLEPGTA